MKTTFIYVLRCPITNDIRYVGKANKPKDRYIKHLDPKANEGSYKHNWVQSLLKQDLKPILEVIDEVPIEKWHSHEKAYIKKFLDEGCKLVNCTDGGDGLTFGNKTSFQKGQGAKPVVALNKDGSFHKEFSSSVEAINYIGKKIDSVLTKKTKTTGGLIWLYKSEYDSLSKEDLDNIVIRSNIKEVSNSEKAKNTQFKKGIIPWNKEKNGYVVHPYSISKIVLQIDPITNEIIKEFAYQADAIREFGSKSIQNALLGKTKSACGFIWKYKEIEKSEEN